MGFKVDTLTTQVFNMASAHSLCSYFCLLLLMAFQAKSLETININSQAKSQETLLVSGYSDKIRSFTVHNSADGPVVKEGPEWSVDPNLTWLQLTDTMAYAIHEVWDFEGVPGGAVSRWEMEGQAWTRQEWLSTESPGPAHLLVVPDYGRAYVSNYGGGSLTVISMQGEKLDKVEKVEHYEGCRDQSHPHQVVSTPRPTSVDDVWWSDWIFLVDLGCDVIRSYTPDGSLVTTTEVKAGAGPRHLALHPNRELAFLACELQSLVQVYRVDQATGTLELLQELEFPSGDEYSAGAEILVLGDYIYASSRGRGVIVVYKLDADDTMHKIQEFDVAGTWPRHMAFCKDGGMLALIDQKGDSVQVLAVDRETMLLSDGGVAATPPGPAFVTFY